ncbi:MAG: hypothetical protein M3Z00_02915 [Actinomycetota bacterium]|nr:hypothetical protein [Actinomycetota bacterium]
MATGAARNVELYADFELYADGELYTDDVVPSTSCEWPATTMPERYSAL